MHTVIRKYTAAPNVVADARPKLAHLEQTMRQTPGFVAYYFLETEDGIATITITEDEAGTQESMGRAATWVQQNLPNSGLGAPEVIRGEASSAPRASLASMVRRRPGRAPPDALTSRLLPIRRAPDLCSCEPVSP
jgi:hypothetical protein